MAGADVKVWAVEKNPNAVVTLRLVTGNRNVRGMTYRVGNICEN